MYAWAGTILRVNLTTRKVVKEALKSEFARAFLGGRGFNSKILYDEFDPAIEDPFSSENIICISSGALSGTLAPGSGRMTISVARSPLTGLFGDANAGGHFGPELKYAGYDTIIIKGAADRPVYVVICNDDVEIRNASHLWGKDIWDTDEMIKEEIGDPDLRVLAIGPAGERRVPIAIPLCDFARAPGGCGTGAVMGSKNLKAIAVRGTKSVKIADPEGFIEACEAAHEQIVNHPLYDDYSTQGTPVLMNECNTAGGLPVKNFQYSTYDKCGEISGPTLVKNYVLKSKGCFSCPLHCSHFYNVNEGQYAGTRGQGVEYEAIENFGSRCDNPNLPSILYMNNLCNSLGLDVIQTGNIIGIAMHLWQDGVIDFKDTDGLLLEWGNHEAMVALVKEIAYKEGFGGVLSEGIIRALEIIAKKKGLTFSLVKKYAIHCKGMGFSGTEVRQCKGAALTYATSTRGADHLRGLTMPEFFGPGSRDSKDEIMQDLDIPPEIVDRWFKLGLLDKNKYEGKGYMAKYFQDQCAVADMLEICKFLTSWWFGIGPQRMARLVSTASGINYTWKNLLECGDRVYTVEYAMQKRYGLQKMDDFPPDRLFTEPIQDGPDKGAILDREKYEKMLDEYYTIRGYDENGVPTRKKLKELELSDVAEDLEKRGFLNQQRKNRMK